MTTSAQHDLLAGRSDERSWIVAAAAGALLALAAFLVPAIGLALSADSDQPSTVAPSPSPQAAPAPPHG